MLELIKFLCENPNPTDEEFHAWAESQDQGVSETEAQAYALASAMVQFLHEGKAFESDLTEDDVDLKELEAGIEIELEHTSNPILAKRIALDHLAEIADYYTRLAQMEGEAGVED